MVAVLIFSNEKLLKKITDLFQYHFFCNKYQQNLIVIL